LHGGRGQVAVETAILARQQRPALRQSTDVKKPAEAGFWVKR
jgi:hypothetical protein